MPTFSPPHIEAIQQPGGAVLIRSRDPMRDHEPSIVHSFRRLSEAHPDRLLVAERGRDEWDTMTWGEARERVDGAAQALLDLGDDGRPVMILSGASRLHLVMTLGAMTVGRPVAPTSVAYSLQSRDHEKLKAMLAITEPALVVAEDASFEPAVEALALSCPVLSRVGDVRGSWSLEEFLSSPTAEVDRRCSMLEREGIAKILFTSGSTGLPKGVINTHGMLAANQAQLRQIWPFLADEPPVLLDWLPWSHTFGGNHNAGLALTNGGSLWIDDGRPAPDLVGRTVRNIQDARPTLYFNVPGGWAALVPHLEQDPDAAAAFFSRLRFGFFAAAALPQQLWDRITKLAAEHGSDMVMTTSWGLTETAPAVTSAHFKVSRSDCLGVPLPGVELKLVPSGAKTEVRVKGPNVMPGYYGAPEATARAFDDSGHLRTGDAVGLIDETDPTAGLIFRGRIAEDFKLATGTWVSVGTLRPRFLSEAQGIIEDAVICGQDADYVGALVWVTAPHATKVTAGEPSKDLRKELRSALNRLAGEGAGSTQRIDRLLILTEPPSLDAGEITDKGYVNQAAARERRADMIARLYVDPPPAGVVALSEMSPEKPQGAEQAG